MRGTPTLAIQLRLDFRHEERCFPRLISNKTLEFNYTDSYVFPLLLCSGFSEAIENASDDNSSATIANDGNGVAARDRFVHREMVCRPSALHHRRNWFHGEGFGRETAQGLSGHQRMLLADARQARHRTGTAARWLHQSHGKITCDDFNVPDELRAIVLVSLLGFRSNSGHRCEAIEQN